MEKSHKGFNFLILIGVIVLLGVGGSKYIHNAKQKKAGISPPIAEVLPSQENNPAIDSQSLYYTYFSQKGLYSVDLPKDWGYVDTNSKGNLTFGIQAFPSVNRHMTAEEELKMSSSLREIIRVDTITPKDATALNTQWELSQNESDADVPNRSPLIKALKMHTGQGLLDGCNGFEYRALTSNRIYLFSGCTKDESHLIQIQDYLIKMIQTLKENEN